LKTTHEHRPGFEECLDPDMHIRFHVLFVERSRFTIIPMKLSSFGISSEESGQFRFLRDDSLTTIKGSVGLILERVSTMRISIPLDLSSQSFIPLPRFIRSRSLTTLFSSFTL
jgi:hypothetical protein